MRNEAAIKKCRADPGFEEKAALLRFFHQGIVVLSGRRQGASINNASDRKASDETTCPFARKMAQPHALDFQICCSPEKGLKVQWLATIFFGAFMGHCLAVNK